MALFAITGLGMLLGAVSVKGLSIGTSGVLFVALVAGHFGLAIPDQIGRFGLAIFVYCVGIGAGGRFFAALAREGGSLAKLSLIIVASAAATAWGLAELLDLPPALAAGLFAGAMTSTPALAAATEGAHQLASDVAIGYGITYPFGVIGVVLFVQLLPKILRNRNLQDTQSSTTESQDVEKSLIEVTNPNLFGSNIGESDLSEITECQVSRVMKEGRLIPLTDEDRFEAGQLLLVVGKPRSIHLACKYLGKRSDQPFIVDTENERQRFVVTAKSVAGQTLRDLAPLRRHGVIITRITRLDQTFVPAADTRIETYDVLTVVGLQEFWTTYRTPSACLRSDHAHIDRIGALRRHPAWDDPDRAPWLNSDDTRTGRRTPDRRTDPGTCGQDRANSRPHCTPHPIASAGFRTGSIPCGFGHYRWSASGRYCIQTRLGPLRTRRSSDASSHVRSICNRTRTT